VPRGRHPDRRAPARSRDGKVGAALTADPRIAGVAFTGSTETARAINRALAARDAPIGVLIAETGGQNAMIVDSSALPEQVARDVMSSAFQSAGQRCSALRVLYLQDDVADSMLAMIRGAFEALVIGDPAELATDVGPVIDAEAKAALDDHIAAMRKAGRRVWQRELPPGCERGTFVARRSSRSIRSPTSPPRTSARCSTSPASRRKTSSG
jgi:RHH-type proline utilization regulon transcriptional repressor/proline dehydrogenase/delta 1-pyrroline-5-carboxylate dehydrogenase